MKKVLTLILAVALLVSTMSTTVLALSYGEEWNGYYHSAPVTFSDVPYDHWAYNAIMRVYEKDWFRGYPDGTFRPNDPITRGEAVKVFVVFLGLDYESVDLSNPSFYDVKASDWYAPFVEAGKDLFPTHTTIQGKRPFNATMPVTREDTIYALVRALGCHVGVKYTDQSTLNMFKDKESISGDLKPYFAIALKHELVSGFPDSTIRGQAALTRAEFASLLLRGTEHGFHDNYEAVISSVTVSPSPVQIAIGETATLTARATYTDGSNQAYTELKPYDADNNGVISINGATITGLKEGIATIKFNDAPLKSQAVSVQVTKPGDAPAIKVTDYFEVTEDASMTIKGTATDKNGAVDLTCNGKDVAVSSNGSFETTVSLSVGINNIKFTATNKYGVEAVKNITIERKASASKPSEEPKTEPEEEYEEESKEETKKDPAVSGEDGTPYFTFDESTGTIIDCGSSADDIVIPEKINGVNVYHIGEGAFADCKYLESVEFPSTLKTIKAEAFSGCIRLFEVEIPEGVTSIGDNAFEGCISMTDAYIPEGVKKIADGLFNGCKVLSNVSLPEGITRIGEYAFEGCKSLDEIELPESTKEIADGAFKDCGSLEEIIIPDNVTEIADNAFEGCNALTIYASVNSYAVEYAKEHAIAWEVI